jgi:hypothetical protein
MLHVIILNVFYAECRYAEWHYDKCRGAIQAASGCSTGKLFAAVNNSVL